MPLKNRFYAVDINTLVTVKPGIQSTLAKALLWMIPPKLIVNQAACTWWRHTRKTIHAEVYTQVYSVGLPSVLADWMFRALTKSLRKDLGLSKFDKIISFVGPMHMHEYFVSLPDILVFTKRRIQDDDSCISAPWMAE